LYFIRLELPRPGASGQINNGPLQAGYVLFIGVANYRNDQTRLESNGDADVDVAVIDDVFAVNGSVENWKRAQSFPGRGRNKGKKRQRN
jgi:hypothetical protein